MSRHIQLPFRCSVMLRLIENQGSRIQSCMQSVLSLLFLNGDLFVQGLGGIYRKVGSAKHIRITIFVLQKWSSTMFVIISFSTIRPLKISSYLFSQFWILTWPNKFQRFVLTSRYRGLKITSPFMYGSDLQIVD